MSGALPGFLPNSLTVDCASKRNFQVYHQYPDLLGLTGVVSMSFARGKYGSYPAGDLFLFPWLKPKAQKLTGKTWPAYVPVNGTQLVGSNPIPNTYLPLDEYFCRYVLQAPWQSFIGFEVNKPYTGDDTRRDWFSNVKLTDGVGVGIDWTSHNLNGPWFGGSNWIPKDDTCSGKAWRKLIITGLDQASTGTC